MALGSCTLRSRLLTLPSSSQDLQGVQCPASFQGAGPLGPFQPFVYSFNKPLLGISNIPILELGAFRPTLAILG